MHKNTTKAFIKQYKELTIPYIKYPNEARK